MWKTVKLGDVCLIRSGNSIAAKKKNELFTNVVGTPYVATKDVGFDGSIDYENGIYIPQEHVSSFKMSPSGSTLVCAEGGSAGRKIAFSTHDCCYVNKLFSITPSESLEAKYIYYYVLSGEFQAQFKAALHGLIGGVSLKKIKEFSMTVPPLAEQQRIVAKLDAAFAEIDRAIDIESEKAREVTALYNSRVTQLLANLMHEREHMKLKELCEKITVGYVGKMSNQYIEDGIPFFRSQSIRPYRISSKGLLYISAEFDESIAKSRLKTNDVCVVRTGYPGTAAVVTEEWDGANCSDLVIFTPSLELNPYFLELFFNSDYGKTLVMGKVVGAAQKHFNVTSAKEVDFPVADLDEQQKIVSTAEGLRNSWEYAISAISRKGEKLTSLKSAILVQELQPSQSEAA